MAWSTQQSKAIWRDPLSLATTLVISNYGLIEEYISEPPAPARGARLYILTPELHAEKYIVYIKFADGVKTILFEYEP